jgi:hypothetical protein
MELTFMMANEIIMVRIAGHNITFANEFTNFTTFVPIDLLILSKQGILKEYPDLKDTPEGELKGMACKRFKEHIKTFKTDNEIMDYVIFELGKYGWELKKTRREGFRDVKVKAM